MRKTLFNNKGLTLVEVLVSIGIFALLALAVSWILITSVRQNAVLWEQLTAQSDGRRVLREVVDVVRRAEESSIGSFPIESADQYELVVYANADSDTLRERIRFFLDDDANTFNMGTIKPGGSPLSYDPADENVVILARSVVNGDQGEPIFSYFDESYTGTESPLSQPVAVSDIHMVKVQLELEEDPTATPVPLHVESMVHIRNLKTN